LWPQASIEDNIYRIESNYLEDTTVGGNIVRGFESYLKGTAPGSGMGGGSSGMQGGGGGGTATRRKGGITDADRIFSRTSAAVSRVSLGRRTSSPGSGGLTWAGFTSAGELVAGAPWRRHGDEGWGGAWIGEWGEGRDAQDCEEEEGRARG
jgi:hypothetical protein